jgi:hypothetical protein
VTEVDDTANIVYPLTTTYPVKLPALNTASPPVNPLTRIVAPALNPAVIGFTAILNVNRDPLAIAAVVAIGWHTDINAPPTGRPDPEITVGSAVIRPP